MKTTRKPLENIRNKNNNKKRKPPPMKKKKWLISFKIKRSNRKQ
jgi:hypothetical protein